MSLCMRLLAGVVLVCWTVWTASPAAAQNVQQQPRNPARARPGMPFGNAQEPTMVTCEGTIAGMARGTVRIAGKGGEAWMVQIPPAAQMLVTGPAGPDFLKPGVSVEFVADVTRHGKVQDPIQSLTIFTVSDQNFLGMFPEASGAFDKAQDKAAPEAAGKGVKDKGAKGDAVASSRYTIRGRITSIKKNKLTLSVGDKTVDGELADNVKVDLRVADSSYAKQGDKISCKAMQFGQNPLQATSVHVELAGSPENVPKETDRAAQPRKTDLDKTEAEDKESPAVADDVAEKLVKLLTPKEPAEKEETFRIDGDSTEFRPSVLGPAQTLQKRFGKPERVTVKGILTTGGKDKTVHWQVLTWGTVKVVVDASRKARFFAAETPPTAVESDAAKSDAAKPDSAKPETPAESEPAPKSETKAEADKPK
jgi:hypothetical protein